MSTPSLNYNQLAADYARHRRVHPGVMESLYQNGHIDTASHILEVGCGTGNYITTLAQLAACRCWGIDPSDGMLEQARQQTSPVDFRNGQAERLDFPDRFFDLIFSVDVIHHLTDRAAFYREAYRALKPGGRLCTVTDSAQIIRRRRPLSLYFRETVAVELNRYPRISTLRDLMQRAGQFDITEDIVEYSYDLTDIEPYRNKAFSTLHLIPEAAFRRGLAWMERDLQQGSIQGLSCYLLLWGTKRS